MSERPKPDITATKNCITAGARILAQSTDLSPEAFEHMSKVFKEVEDLLTAIEEGATTAHIARAADEIDVDYSSIIQKLHDGKDVAARLDVKAKISNKRMMEVETTIQKMADGDLELESRIWREMLEPTVTQNIEVPGGLGNIVNEVDVASTRVLGRMYKALNKMEPGLIQIFKGGKDNKFARDFALLLEGGMPAVRDKTTAIAQEAVKIFKEETKQLIERANKAGHDITFDDLWGVRDYTPEKILGYSKSEFVAFLAPKLKGSPAEAKRIASYMYVNAENMTSVNSLRSRKLDFKTPNDALEVFDALSNRTISDVIQGNVHKLAKTAVWSEKFGPMGETGFVKHLEAKVDKITDVQNTKAGGNPRKRLKSTILQTKFHSGILDNHEVSAWVTNAGTVRNFIAAGLLHAVQMYTVTSDIPKGVLRTFQLSGRPAAGFVEATKYMSDVVQAMISPGKYAQALEHLDSMQAGMLTAQANDLLSVRQVPGAGKMVAASRLSSKAARMNYQINLVDRMSNASYIGVQMSTLRTLHKAGRTLDDVGKYSPELRNSLKKAGISDDMWAQIADPSNVSGGMIDPTKIADPKVRETIAAWQKAESYNSISRPDNYTSWMFETAGGQIEGQTGRAIFKVLTQFMGPQFAVGRGLARTINSQGFYGGWGKAGYTAGAVGTLVLGGMMHVQLRRVLKGQPLYDIRDPLLRWEGIDKSGILFLGGGLGAMAARGERTGRGGFLEDTQVLNKFFSPAPAIGGKIAAGAFSYALSPFREDPEMASTRGRKQMFQAVSSLIPASVFASSISSRAYGGSLMEILEDSAFPGTMDMRADYHERLVEQP